MKNRMKCQTAGKWHTKSLNPCLFFADLSHNADHLSFGFHCKSNNCQILPGTTLNILKSNNNIIMIHFIYTAHLKTELQSALQV